MDEVSKILASESPGKAEIIQLSSLQEQLQVAHVFQHAAQIREKQVGNFVYLRGLIEYSNFCRKDCYYCGIRKSNKNVYRYNVDFDDVIECARFAHDYNYSSLVIQTGERVDKSFSRDIEKLLHEINRISESKLGITLSCGEQSRETYQRWFDAGAQRYLLRFESSNKELYYRMHPKNDIHRFENRLESISSLRDIGYQVGSGMMVGLPGQTLEHVADDILFLQKLDVDMVGLGPYIEHHQTPLFKDGNMLWSKEDRLLKTLLTIALVRIIMKDVNIAASTALDSLDPKGRELAIKSGANVLMPNLTPLKYRENYFLYEDKPFLTEAQELVKNIQYSEQLRGFKVKFGEWGNSFHFTKRKGLN